MDVTAHYNIQSYETKSGIVKWKFDEWIYLEDKPAKRVAKQGFKSYDAAMNCFLETKRKLMEGEELKKKLPNTITVRKVWEKYEPVAERNRSYSTDTGRAKHLLEHLGDWKACTLTLEHVDQYRSRRRGKKTHRGNPPSSKSLDNEIELLKRMLNYAVDCGYLKFNPIRRVKFLNAPNTRDVVITEEIKEKILDELPAVIRPIIELQFDTGMRREEVLSLKKNQLFLKDGVIRLRETDTKTQTARVVPLTQRVIQSLKELPVFPKSDYVFNNPKTETRWRDIKRSFHSACKAAGVPHVWMHDLRRSFATHARKRGIPETVVMKITGHKTRSIFARYNIIDEDDLKNAAELFEAKAQPEQHQQAVSE